MAKTIREALAAEAGSVLAFLPGQREIERTAERLAGRLPDNCRCRSALRPARRQGAGRGDPARARRPPQGRARDLHRRDLDHHRRRARGRSIPACRACRATSRRRGLTRLETVRVSRASADQRAGRAGRTRARRRDPAVARRADRGAARLHAAGNPAGRSVRPAARLRRLRRRRSDDAALPRPAARRRRSPRRGRCFSGSARSTRRAA